LIFSIPRSSIWQVGCLLIYVSVCVCVCMYVCVYAHEECGYIRLKKRVEEFWYSPSRDRKFDMWVVYVNVYMCVRVCVYVWIGYIWQSSRVEWSWIFSKKKKLLYGVPHTWVVCVHVYVYACVCVHVCICMCGVDIFGRRVGWKNCDIFLFVMENLTG